MGTNKGMMDKISDGMNKLTEIMQKFFRQVQSMGSATLRGMAKALGFLGLKPAAEWLNEMAGADYAELKGALTKAKLSLIEPKLDANEPQSKTKTEEYERALADLAAQYKVLAQTRGPTFTREVYYNEVVREWKKKEGNGGKTAVIPEDLQAMAAVSKELPATLPEQVAQGPEFVQPLDSLVTPMNIMSGVPAKITVSNKTVSMQAGSNGEMVISVAGGAPLRYRLSPKVDGVTGLTWQMRSMLLSKDGLQIDGTAAYKVGTTDMNSPYPSKLVSITEIRPFLESVVNNPNGAPVVGTDFRFERNPV